MRRLTLACTALLCALPAQSARTQATAWSLADAWSLEGLLVDSNDDGFADGLRCGVAPADPGNGDDLTAAANVMARLGYEVLALDLPASTHESVCVTTGGRLDDDRPGLGRVDARSPGSVSIRGTDAAGLHAATRWFAGHAPVVWSEDLTTLRSVEELLRDWLAGIGHVSSRVRITAVDVLADIEGVESLHLDVSAAVTLEELLNDSAPAPLIAGVRHLVWNTPGDRLVTGSGDVDTTELDAYGEGGGDEFDLADMYSPDGLLSDANGDHIPDGLNATISSTAESGTALLDFAARLGVESAGMRLPAVTAPGRESWSSGVRLLIGSDHPALESAANPDEIPPPPADGGRIEWLSGLFEEEPALVVRGAAGGTEVATRYLATRAPHLGPYRRDTPSLATLRTDLRRFLARRTSAGQAAAAIDIAAETLGSLPPDAVEVDLTITVDRPEEGLEDHVRQRLAGLRSVVVQGRDVRSAPEVWSLEETLVSEPEQLINRLRELLGPGLDGGGAVLRAHVSEPRPVRERLRQQASDALLAAGADTARVSVLPAYKQGFGWLEEEILPRLRDLRADRVVIRYARHEAPPEWPYQAMQTPTRWLLELFPIDEILARELGLALDAIRFEQIGPDGPTYRVSASRDGVEVLAEDFTPASVLRPYFDLYPAYETVRVTAGWLWLEADGNLLADEHLPTDLERVWDLYQREVLPQLHDYTMRLHEGEPMPERAPHFGELLAEIALSEPDRELGIDRERIAPMEALHEEIYFGTLHFFDLLGRVARGRALAYPGRVLPIVRPLGNGESGQVRFRLTGFASPVPRVEVRYRVSGRQEVLRRDLPPLELEPPRVRALDVRPDGTVGAVAAWVAVDAHEEDRQALLVRHRERQLDSRWVTTVRLAGAVAELSLLRAAGLYDATLNYPDAPDLRLALGAGFEPDASDRAAELPGLDRGTSLASIVTTEAALAAALPVQWERPMPPDEAHTVIAAMAQEFPEAAAYRVGNSYLGREIWSLDLTAAPGGTHWSPAKMSAAKPTVVYSARQHANEVSSTSHVLRMAELLLTDPEWQPVLDRINVVVHPITNPDGAQLAYDLHRITPDHMLHAGYLGSLGVDVTAGAGDPDPVYPETEVRDLIWNTWLPDIFLNPHGYPSHEWVQPFSEYAGWVRHRTTQSRDWWGMRGWFMPGFAYLDDPDYPRHREHAFRIRTAITTAINDVPDIVALNERAYARYRRYGADHDDDAFKLNFADDVLIYTALEGSRAGGNGFMTRNPKVTIWSGSTEAPDETAYGDWLELVASAGLAWDQAILRYLLELEHPAIPERSYFRDAAVLRFHRERPGQPREEQ